MSVFFISQRMDVPGGCFDVDAAMYITGLAFDQGFWVGVLRYSVYNKKRPLHWTEHNALLAWT